MKRTVFYSWQSDLPGSTNRNFIEETLKRALKSIRRNESESVEPVLDRDTAGISGSPSISDSILAKITLANVFVADISIINPEQGGRPSPNPNVLIELGYAIARLGWDRVLLIQNTFYGGPERPPFDLRGRRVIPYELATDATDKPIVRGSLQGRLENELKNSLRIFDKTSANAGPDVPLWWGHWNTTDEGGMHGGALFIYDVGPAGFLFTLSVFNGAHSGELIGYAHIVAADLAYGRVTNGDVDGMCEIVIRRRLSERTRIIEIDETSSCSYWRGMGVLFAGSFIRKRDTLFDGGVFDELDLSRLYKILGTHFEDFRRSFQSLSEAENLDDYSAIVFVGGSAGLYTTMEGIAMRGDSGQLWIAYIDDDIVRYFTTECQCRTELPLTIEHWRERFSQKEVVFSPCVDFVPGKIIYGRVDESAL